MNMIPKFRAWYEQGFMLNPDNIISINFYEGYLGWAYMLGDEVENDGISNFDQLKIMEDTGIDDKKGQDIFEGDIVKVHRFQQGHVGGNYGVVEVEEEMVCVVEKATVEPYIYPCEWFLVDVYDEEPENLWLSSGLHEESYEVIGNIFENESLLKELE